MANDNDCCVEFVSDEVISLSNQLALVRQNLTDARTTYGELLKKQTLQYSLDTGQTRQSAMNVSLSTLEKSINWLQRQEEQLKTQIDSLTGKGGHAFVFVPLRN